MINHAESTDATVHHGEYKIPEGKLVVVDLQVVQQHHIEVVRRISGGGAMFIEPCCHPNLRRSNN